VEALFRRFICRLLVVSTIMLPYSAPSQAAMIGVERANALTDDEVEQLAGRIDSLPAGAEISTAGLLLVLIVILLIFMFRR